MDIDIEVLEKVKIKDVDEETGQYRVVFRANGTLLYKHMLLNNDIPDNVLILFLERAAKKLLAKYS